jgi:hypothetical protein
MLARLLDRLLRCSHNDYSFPITPRPSRTSTALRPSGTYVVCLDCGRELAYDWNTMKVGVPADRLVWRGLQSAAR